MHVDQNLMNMLNGPVRGSASTSANQSKSSCQDSKTSDPVNKGSEEFPPQSTQSKDDLMDGGSKEPSGPKRERESERQQPSPKETSGAASSTQEIAKEEGTHTESKARKPESSENDGQSAAHGIETHWSYVKTDSNAQDEAKRMHRTLPAWKLKDCMRLLCAQPPDLMKVAKL